MTLGREDLLKSRYNKQWNEERPRMHSTPVGYIAKSSRNKDEATICIFNLDNTKEYCHCNLGELFQVIEGKRAFVTFYPSRWRKFER